MIHLCDGQTYGIAVAYARYGIYPYMLARAENSNDAYKGGAVFWTEMYVTQCERDDSVHCGNCVAFWY